LEGLLVGKLDGRPVGVQLGAEVGTRVGLITGIGVGNPSTTGIEDGKFNPRLGENEEDGR